MSSQASETIRVASLPPPIRENPYQRLLYAAMQQYGIELAHVDRLRASWLWSNRSTVSTLHFHWPTPYYLHDRGPEKLRPMLSWARVILFFLRLLLARGLDYRIVWTVHEVVPHDSGGKAIDRAAARALAGTSHSFTVHDDATRLAVEAVFGRARGRTMVIPHPKFVGVYPNGRDRAVVRAELGIAADDVVFLCFGNIRGYKDIDVLVKAFHTVRDRRAVLVVAGSVMHRASAALLRTGAATDPRIRLAFGYVPDDSVAELFAASDVAVVSRGDGGTSGVLVLALSLGVPVIAACRPTYEALTGIGAAGWHFRPGDPVSLASAFEAAASDPKALHKKRQRAVTALTAGDWSEMAGRMSTILRGTRQPHLYHALRPR